MQIDEQELQHAMDRCKSSVFLGNNSAFLGSLMCGLELIWDSKTARGTAATDGVRLWWCPEFFMKLLPETRKTVLMHELWHPGRLHMIRCGSRDPKVWNWACDIRINNDLKREGYSFVGIEWCWLKPELDDNGIMAEEDIYDFLMQSGLQPPPPPMGGGSDPGQGDGTMGQDMVPGNDPSTQLDAVANVVKAIQSAIRAGKPGQIPGGTESRIKKFLTPVVPWEALLYQFFTDLLDEEHTWARPNRRYQDIYLPSRFLDDGRLEHLIYYLDVSGSITPMERLRFNSEVKYIKETFNPVKLTLVQFDTQIQRVDVYTESDPFEEVPDVHGGGTCLKCVLAHINMEKPTAAIIFSDLDVRPMGMPDEQIPVIWVTTGNRYHKPSFGKFIHIKR